MSGEIKYVEFLGTRETIGNQIGSYFRSEIQATVDQDENLNKKFLPFYNTKQGKNIVEAFLQKSQTYFPEYVQELKGYADGAQVEFLPLFLLNLEVEIYTMLEMNPVVRCEGCTTIMINKGDTALMGHTEDLIPIQTKYSHLVKYRIMDGDKELENLTFVMIPGLLPGNTTGFNSHGLAMAQNICFQKNINTEGIPRRFITRAKITSASISQMKSIISTGPGPTVGFCMNVSEQLGDGVKISSLEVTASQTNGACIKDKVVQDVYYICNEFKQFNVPYIADPSSTPRDQVLKHFLSERTKDTINASDVLTILSDTSDKEFPVYRNGAEPDYLSTYLVSVFDLKARRVDFYANQPFCSKPSLSFLI